jgi:hypothetical protein
LAVGSSDTLAPPATVAKSWCADGASSSAAIDTWTAAVAVLPWPSLTV